MTQLEPFELDVNGSTVSGTLALPDGAPDAVHPAVLICRGLHTFDDETAALFRELDDSLVDAGLAVVEFDPRSAKMILEDFHAYTASDNVDDAAAVFRWMLVCERVDHLAVGVLGYDLGGITAACLARRSDQIAALALLAPAGHGEKRPSEEDPAFHGPDEMPAGYADSLRALEPVHDIIFHDRPTLIVHGAADREISPDASLAYRHALELAGRHVQHVQVALADHRFSSPDARAACLDQIDRFFAEMATATTSGAGR